jgi:hypothetical protein
MTIGHLIVNMMVLFGLTVLRYGLPFLIICAIKDAFCRKLHLAR